MNVIRDLVKTETKPEVVYFILRENLLPKEQKHNGIVQKLTDDHKYF